MTTVFGKIIKGELPAEKVFENDRFIVIKDLHPIAPIHLLIISKKEIKGLQAVEEVDLSLMKEVVQIAQQLAKEHHVEDGYRLLTNNGVEAGQTIFHLHFHFIAGRTLGAMG